MTDRKVATHLQLQTRHSSTGEWGTLNTVLIQHDPYSESKGMKSAKAEVESLRNRWHENYDPTLQFRIVKL